MAIDPEVKALIDGLQATVARLEKRVSELEAENAELRSRVGKDSSNSNKPPSTDNPFKRKPPKARGARKVGGQPGHKGVTRAIIPPEKVNERRVIRPGACPCGHDLVGVSAEGKPLVRQVVEIPRIEPHVTEFLLHAVRCPACRTLNRPEVPAEAQTGTGPVLTALAAMLVGQYRLSREAVADLLARILDMPICGATVQASCERIGEALAAPMQELENALPSTESVHMDETSWKERGVLRWLWVAVSERFSCFSVHARRGIDQLNAWFPNGYRGRVHCDRWRPYEIFERRQLCWSHLERDLQSVIDRGAAGARRAEHMLAGAVAMFAIWRRFDSNELDRAALVEATSRFRLAFRRFCLAGARQREDRKWRALGRDLLRQWPAVFRFIDAPGFEPTNNAAERGLRTAVLWRRCSQGTRTERGSAFVGRILSVVATCKQQGRDVLGYLAEALLAHRSGLPHPGLLAR
jgi:transposase